MSTSPLRRRNTWSTRRMRLKMSWWLAHVIRMLRNDITNAT